MDLKWLALRYDVTAILDVGANDGAFAAYLQRTFSDVPVFAFEPQEKYQSMLRERGFETFCVALSDHAGYAQFYETEADAASSLHVTSELCREAYPTTQIAQTTQVQTARLDDLIPPVDGSLIKIDAQGAELAIIAGAQDHLRTAQIVLIEQTFQVLYEGQALFNEVHAALAELDLSMIGFRGQGVDEHQGGMPLFAHCIYVRG
ncbi:MAG: FkbM family methyltransferase [Pseudomonadota bacterium]